MNLRTRIIIGGTTVCVVLSALVAFGYKFYFSRPATVSTIASTTLASSGVAPAQQAPLGPHRAAPAGEKEYYDAQYFFSLFYPSDLSVTQYDNGGGAETITFQDVAAGQGFQMFIVPYGLSQVSDAQFERDEPSGVREGETNLSVDGATGAAFYSTDATLGDTYEVWFVHDDYLYEVTTLKPLDSWLDTIMQSWKFL